MPCSVLGTMLGGTLVLSTKYAENLAFLNNVEFGEVYINVSAGSELTI